VDRLKGALHACLRIAGVVRIDRALHVREVGLELTEPSDRLVPDVNRMLASQYGSRADGALV